MTDPQGPRPEPGDDGVEPEQATPVGDVDDMTAGINQILDGDTPDDVPIEAEVLVEADLSDVDVAAVLAERDEYKTLAQTIQAEFQNFKRVSVERAQVDSDRATGKLAEAMLPVLDAAEAAFVNHPDEIGPLLNQMLVELKKAGLEALDLAGQPFDPEVAEAVAHEPGDGGEPVVADVLRSGYRWKGKTLRPAMVRTKD